MKKEELIHFLQQVGAEDVVCVAEQSDSSKITVAYKIQDAEFSISVSPHRLFVAESAEENACELLLNHLSSFTVSKNRGDSGVSGQSVVEPESTGMVEPPHAKSIIQEVFGSHLLRYDTIGTVTGSFVTKLMCGSKAFEGTPQRSKKAAEEAAAKLLWRFAVDHPGVLLEEETDDRNYRGELLLHLHSRGIDPQFEILEWEGSVSWLNEDGEKLCFKVNPCRTKKATEQLVCRKALHFLREKDNQLRTEN